MTAPRSASYLEYARALGARLRELRKQHGLTQVEVAARANVNKTTISRAENGQSIPDDAAIGRLADAFGVDALELLHLAGRSLNRDAFEERVLAKLDAILARLDEALPETGASSGPNRP